MFLYVLAAEMNIKEVNADLGTLNVLERVCQGLTPGNKECVAEKPSSAEQKDFSEKVSAGGHALGVHFSPRIFQLDSPKFWDFPPKIPDPNASILLRSEGFHES